MISHVVKSTFKEVVRIDVTDYNLSTRDYVTGDAMLN